MINKFFDIVVCLTQKKRHDRWLMLQDEINKGIDIMPFYVIEDKDPKISFCNSQIAMLKWFLTTDNETILCLEDDVKFDNLDKFRDAAKELPKDWQIFYLGANAKPYAEFTPAEPYSNHLRIIRSAYCTHAIAYKRSMVERIVKEYEYVEGQLYDTWLDINILKKVDCYISVPMIATQKPVRSDLWERVVDYRETWVGSNDYLCGI
jgi:hypothetical protein